jgi:hypothetical protein
VLDRKLRREAAEKRREKREVDSKSLWLVKENEEYDCEEESSQDETEDSERVSDMCKVFYYVFLVNVCDFKLS